MITCASHTLPAYFLLLHCNIMQIVCKHLISLKMPRGCNCSATTSACAGEFIKDTEEYINIELDSSRNRLIRLEIVLTAGTFAVAIWGLVGSEIPLMFHLYVPIMGGKEDLVPTVRLVCCGHSVPSMLCGSAFTDMSTAPGSAASRLRP